MGKKLPTFPPSLECSNCGRRCCCCLLPGSAFPEDFDFPEMTDKLITALASGLWSIDWWEGDPRPGMSEIEQGYYIRPTTKEKQGILFDASWGGICIFWRENGCLLSIDDRPGGCRSLKPRTKSEETCRYPLWEGMDTNDKQMAAIAWIPYHADLLRIAGEIEKATKED